jgi:hypothetical protein
MKRSLFAGLAIAMATTAFAQTPQPPATPSAAGVPNETVTLIGCVAGGAAASDPFTLSDVTHGSVGANTPGQMISGALPPPAAVPAGAAPTPAPGTPAAGAAMPPASAGAGTVGTAGTTGAAGAGAGTVGTAGTAAAGAAGAGSAASPAAAGAAPAPGAAPVGYRLNGYDVSAYRGQRVQIVGSFAPADAAGATPAAGTNPAGMPAAAAPREFRVQSVTPVSGNCAQR